MSTAGFSGYFACRRINYKTARQLMSMNQGTPSPSSASGGKMEPNNAKLGLCAPWVVALRGLREASVISIPVSLVPALRCYHRTRFTPGIRLARIAARNDPGTDSAETMTNSVKAPAWTGSKAYWSATTTGTCRT